MAQRSMRTSPQVLTPPDELEDLLFDQRPTVHDLRVAHANDDETSHDQSPISGAIGLEVVPRRPVQLEHQPVTDQQVDAAHSGNPELRNDANAETSEG